MMHNYISIGDFNNLKQTGRKAVIVRNVTSKDIDEYINNCIITMQNCNVDTNLFMQPRVLKENNTINIVFMLRAYANDKIRSLQGIQGLSYWIQNMDNVVLINS